MKNPLLSRRSSSNPDSCSAQWIAMVAIVTARMCEGVSRCRGWRCAVCAPRGIRVTMPRTLAPDRGDGVGVPEIASRVPPLPNRDGLRRMRGMRSRRPGRGGLVAVAVLGQAKCSHCWAIHAVDFSCAARVCVGARSQCASVRPGCGGATHGGSKRGAVGFIVNAGCLGSIAVSCASRLVC